MKEIIKDTINGYPSEVAFYDKNNILVGYWAFGYFDPELPYQGNLDTYPEVTPNIKMG